MSSTPTIDDLTCPDGPQFNRPSLWDVLSIIGLLLGIIIAISVDWDDMESWAQIAFAVLCTVFVSYLLFRIIIGIFQWCKSAKCKLDSHPNLSQRLSQSLVQEGRLRAARNNQNVLIANIGSGRVTVRTTPYHITDPHHRDGKLCFVIPLLDSPPLVVDSTLVIFDRPTGEELAVVRVVSEQEDGESVIAEVMQDDQMPPDQLFVQHAEVSASQRVPYQTRGIILQRTFTNLPDENHAER